MGVMASSCGSTDVDAAAPMPVEAEAEDDPAPDDDAAQEEAQAASIAAVNEGRREPRPAPDGSGGSHRAEPRRPVLPNPPALPDDRRPDTRVGSLTNFYDRLSATSGQLGMYPPNQIYALIQKLPFDRQNLQELPIEARTGRNWRYVHYRQELENELEAYLHLTPYPAERERRRVLEYEISKLLAHGSRPGERGERTFTHMSSDEATEEWHRQLNRRQKDDISRDMYKLLRHNKNFHREFNRTAGPHARADGAVTVKYLVRQRPSSSWR